LKEAQSVFFDENALRFFDPDHSNDEDRFIMLGMSVPQRALIVCHCFRGERLDDPHNLGSESDKREERAIGGKTMRHTMIFQK